MQWKKIRKSSLMIALLLASLSCGDSSDIQDQSEHDNTSQDFERFYDRFHSDSAFQLQHIQWPLEGLPAHADTLSDPASFRWQQENWALHRPFNDALTGFTKSLTTMGEGLIIENITHEEGGFKMERRFAKIDNEWKLIYYAALNH